MTGENPIIAIRDWSCGYLDEPIVVDFSFDLTRGTIACIVGSNGAGKSTLLRSIYGTIKRFKGELYFAGEQIESLKPIERMARGISFVPQGRCNFPYLSVAENMQLAAHTLSKSQEKKAVEKQINRFPVIRNKWRERASNLSGGEQQMLEMAMAFVVEPTLLLIDEPSLGLSPKMRTEVFETIRELAHDDLSIVMVEQNVRGGLAVSDTAIVMDLGRKVMEGSPEEILADSRINSVFLGGSPHD